MRHACLSAIAALVLTGCGTASTVDPTPTPTPTPSVAVSPTTDAGYTDLDLVEAPDGLLDGTMSGPDGAREVVVHLPDGGGADAPLVLGLHPFGFDGPQFDRLTGLGAAGTAAGAVVAFPNGLGGSWNAGLTCCPPATVDQVDDVGFLTSLVGRLHRQLGTDPSRAWAIGFSNGGFMALRLACDAGATVTAVVSHAGTMDPRCPAEEPVSVLLSHGDADPVVPIDGGGDPVGPETDGRGVRELHATWLALDDCPSPEPSELVDTTASPCAAGTAVSLDVWPDLGHAWPSELTVRALAWLEAHGRR